MPKETRSPSILWFRLDLRLEDNPALNAAIARGGPVVPVFIWAPDEEAPWQPGSASRWWLNESLKALDASLQKKGSRLILRSGESLEVLRSIIHETGADAVFWNRRYEPAVISRDSRIKNSLRNTGILVESFNSALLNEPWTILNKSGRPFQVFTPFWKACTSNIRHVQITPEPGSIPASKVAIDSAPLESLKLDPRHDWKQGLVRAWTPGETGAKSKLQRFLSHAGSAYELGRDYPVKEASSQLSPHLHFGEISPRQVWAGLEAAWSSSNESGSFPSSKFASELGWREFAHHLLFHFPHTTNSPLRDSFREFPWRKNPDWLKAWQKGRTGVPMVDAGMRELWGTGWMHNRVRMIAASFLVKNLLISWEDGARWFWETLVDADLANNTLGWQWTAGCGADAAPFFRIFNPLTQGLKFDPQADYIRSWVPELVGCSSSEIHGNAQRSPGLAIPSSGPTKPYPMPIINLTVSRLAALDAYSKIKGRS